jgi:hypothetical protein
VKFAENIARIWASSEKDFNDLYFKRIVAKAILFRTVDKLVLKQPWYGGLKAQIVTYTIAKLSQMIEDSRMFLNLEKIWTNQSISLGLENLLVSIADKVNIEIQTPPTGITNLSEWCKKEFCWKNIQKVPMELPYEQLQSDLISITEKRQKDRDAKDVRSIDNGIQAQKYVLEKGAPFWSKLVTWSITNRVFSPKESGLLNTASQIPFKIPSEKQSLLLLDIEQKANREGFLLP